MQELRAAVNRFAGDGTARKVALLERCSACALDDPRVLVAYHDCLLFMLAYPENQQLLVCAQSELRRVAEVARGFSEAKSERRRQQLFGTGLAWSESSSAFSYDIAAWLVGSHAELAEIDYPAEGGRSLQSVLKLCMPAIELELFEEERSDADDLLAEARGAASGSKLSWLIAQLERLPCPEQIREQLFESLQLFISIRPQESPLSRTFARGLAEPVFFHSEELLRAVEVRSLVDQPLPRPRRLARRARLDLIDAARGVLAIMGRETDPITLTTAKGVEYLDLGRGATLALYSMRPRRRFPLDTHVGFMLFKNTVPVAYGGGWPFLGTCKIGINIFSPFRGGESTYLFSQILRVYRQRFACERFLVEPYQFGAHNREGLLSGAFWFYYRLGFRPMRAAQAALARDEFARIESEDGYRSPLAVMRRLTRSDLELRLADGGEGPTPWPDPGVLSLAVSAWIGREFAGDRAAAEAAALSRVAKTLDARNIDAWPPGEQHSFRTLSLLVAMIADLQRWSATERRTCVALMRAKGAAGVKGEARFSVRSQRHRRFREAMSRIVASVEG